MEINNELVLQWEPKIQKMVSNTFIVGMDNEDVAQELRISLIKAAKKFNKDKGVLFHTYLHTSLVNAIRTLISKAQRRPISRSLDESFGNFEGKTSSTILHALISSTDDVEEMEATLWLETQDLSNKEKYFVDLKLKGLTMDEITIKLRDNGVSESSYKVRQGIRDKVNQTFLDEEPEQER
jgi:RNA polymerase sigma factor (sigma-70 family)